MGLLQLKLGKLRAALESRLRSASAKAIAATPSYTRLFPGEVNTKKTWLISDLHFESSNFEIRCLVTFGLFHHFSHDYSFAIALFSRQNRKNAFDYAGLAKALIRAR